MLQEDLTISTSQNFQRPYSTYFSLQFRTLGTYKKGSTKLTHFKEIFLDKFPEADYDASEEEYSSSSAED